MAYDVSLRQPVVFGGLSYENQPATGTFLFDRGYWKTGTSVDDTGPSPRIDGGMAYDPQTKRVILFGGRSGDGAPAGLPAETWGYAP